MATQLPRGAPNRGETFLQATVGSMAGFDRTDRRYRASARREMREGVWVQLILSLIGVVGSFAFVGFEHLTFDAAALAVLAFAVAVAFRRRLVHSYPQGVATIDGMLLVLMLAVGVAVVPEPALAIGAFGLMIAASASFVIRDGAGRIVWLAVAVGIFTLALAFAPMDIGLKAQGLYVAGFAAIACAGGHLVSQRRRRRTMGMEALLRQQRRELREAVRTLKTAQKTIDVLEGVLPICAHCKRIRDAGTNAWVGVEAYLEQRSKAQFSHGICPDCMRRYYSYLDSDSTE